MPQCFALVATLAIEVPVVMALAPRRVRQERLARTAVVAALPSLLTHPFLWSAALAIADDTRGGALLLVGLEIAVALVEALLLAWLLPATLRRATLCSLAANTASFGAGLILERLGLSS